MKKGMAHDWPFKNLLRTKIYIVNINIFFEISFIHVDFKYHNHYQIEVKDLVVTYLTLPKYETTVVVKWTKSLIFDLYESQSLAGLGCWWGPRPFPPLVNHSLVTNSFPKVLACLLWWWWWWWWWLILKQSLGNLNWGCENVNKWIISSMWSVSNNHIIIKDIVVFWWWILWWSLWHCLIFHFLKAL